LIFRRIRGLSSALSGLLAASFSLSQGVALGFILSAFQAEITIQSSPVGPFFADFTNVLGRIELSFDTIRQGVYLGKKCLNFGQAVLAFFEGLARSGLFLAERSPICATSLSWSRGGNCAAMAATLSRVTELDIENHLQAHKLVFL
jgi:hypothetical protein